MSRRFTASLDGEEYRKNGSLSGELNGRTSSWLSGDIT
jgi:hypothetical protein